LRQVSANSNVVLLACDISPSEKVPRKRQITGLTEARNWFQLKPVGLFSQLFNEDAYRESLFSGEETRPCTVNIYITSSVCPLFFCGLR